VFQAAHQDIGGGVGGAVAAIVGIAKLKSLLKGVTIGPTIYGNGTCNFSITRPTPYPLVAG